MSGVSRILKICCLLASVLLAPRVYGECDCVSNTLQEKLDRLTNKLDQLEAKINSPATPDKYSVTVEIGTSKFANTTSPLFVTLYGETGNCGEHWLIPETNNTFYAASQEHFELYCGVKIGTLKILRVELKDTDDALLEKITVEDTQSDVVYEFPCSCWLGDDNAATLVRNINADTHP